MFAMLVVNIGHELVVRVGLVAVALSRTGLPRARIPEQVREEVGRVSAPGEEEQKAAADVDVRRRRGPRRQQDRCVHHVRHLRVGVTASNAVSNHGPTRDTRRGRTLTTFHPARLNAMTNAEERPVPS